MTSQWNEDEMNNIMKGLEDQSRELYDCAKNDVKHALFSTSDNPLLC